jgi:hypothetical protein
VAEWRSRGTRHRRWLGFGRRERWLGPDRRLWGYWYLEIDASGGSGGKGGKGGDSGQSGIGDEGGCRGQVADCFCGDGGSGNGGTVHLAGMVGERQTARLSSSIAGQPDRCRCARETRAVWADPSTDQAARLGCRLGSPARAFGGEPTSRVDKAECSSLARLPRRVLHRTRHPPARSHCPPLTVVTHAPARIEDPGWVEREKRLRGRRPSRIPMPPACLLLSCANLVEVCTASLQPGPQRFARH